MNENSCFFAVVVTFIVIVLICCVPFVLESKTQDPRISAITWDPNECLLSWSYWNEQGEKHQFTIDLHDQKTGTMTDGTTKYPLAASDQLDTHRHLTALTIYVIQSTDWFEQGGVYQQVPKQQPEKINIPQRTDGAGLLLSAVASVLP